MRTTIRWLWIAIASAGHFLTASRNCVLSDKITRLDLTHRPHIPPTAIVEAVVSHTLLRRDDNPQGIEIDVSDSFLKDDGIQYLCSRIVQIQEGRRNTHPTNPPLHIDLKAQMNGLTGNGVAKLMEALLRNHHTNSIQNTTTTQVPRFTITMSPFIRSLDLGWNRLHNDHEGIMINRSTDSIAVGSNSNRRIEKQDPNKAFQKALEALVASSSRCPEHLYLEKTGLGPAACRALAKGIISRWENNRSTSSSSLLSLYLAGNPNIGNSGAAALAAALRTVICHQHDREGDITEHGHDNPHWVLDTLDLSACDISDAGVEALALAFEEADGVCPVRRLLLNHNKITNQGSIALGRVFRDDTGRQINLGLDNNRGITDRGIATLLEVVQQGKLSNLSLRSCSIHADGAERVGKALRHMKDHLVTVNNTIQIDLSGNPIGILRGKSKTEGSMYSASRLKSQASSTAAAYMNQGINFLKKNMAPALLPSSFNTVESDDEEENTNTMVDTPAETAFGSEEDEETSKKRCGFKALANSFIGEDHSSSPIEPILQESNVNVVYLGLRRTFCDTAGADALAALLLAPNDDRDRIDLKLEVDLNPVVEEQSISALLGHDKDRLREMAERHNDAMEVIRTSQRRAIEAVSMAAARREERGYNYDPNDQREMLTEPYDDEEPDNEEFLEETLWDSDVDYENEDEAYR